MSAQKGHGFTLVELMITITIIAILSTVGMVAYSSSQRLARDSKRKQDVQEISKALALYYSDNRRYPSTVSGGPWQFSTSASTPWIDDKGSPALPLNINYISQLPKDPLNTATNLYQYYSDPSGYGTCTANQYYILAASLENTSDPDRYFNKPFSICGSSPAGFCNTASCNMYVIAGP